MVIVGHRPSTLAHADKVLVLKDGRMEMYGPRDAVLQRLRKATVTTTDPKPPQIAPAGDPTASPSVVPMSAGGSEPQ